MIIQHNIMALNSYNKLSGNNSMVQKNLEKLSSGYRINRAGDDAAGLAISEKMRAQITGLERAKLNAQDGISLVQTAEGALTEVHSMLNRLVELGTESANGIYQAEDRQKIQDEVNQITEEIDRISEATNFNGIKLLDGSLGMSDVKVDNTVKDTMEVVLPSGTKADGSAITSDWNAPTKQLSIYDTADFDGDATTTADKFDDGKIDAVRIEFKTADGTTKSFTLYETAKDSVTANEAGKAIAATILGTADADSTFTFNQKDAAVIEEFRNAFTVSQGDGGAGELKIEAKEAGTKGASLIGVTHATHTDPITDSTTWDAATKTAGITADDSKVAQAAGVTVTGADLTDGAKVTIGGKTYEFKDDPTDSVESGNIMVATGGGGEVVMRNLIAALNENGINAELLDAGKGTAATQVLITSLDKISANQQGVGISSNTNTVRIEQVSATANKTDLSLGAGAAGTYSARFEYVDANGKTQTMDLSYTLATGSAAATDAATAIKNAFENNTELNNLFKVTDDGAGTLSFETRIKGADGAKIHTITTTDSTATAIDGVVTTLGKDGGKKISFADNPDDTTKTLNLKAGDTITVDGKTLEFVKYGESAAKGNIGVYVGDTDVDTMKNFQQALSDLGVKSTLDPTGKELTIANDQKATKITGEGLTLQVGDTADEFNKVTVSVDDMSAKGLGLDDLLVTDQGLAAESIDAVKAAIEKVSVNRGRLGALQNRLEHTINNLTTTTENMTAAESRIRDTDMAKEMMNFTKNNVLVQAAQAMLAQANQQPQQVLQLLR